MENCLRVKSNTTAPIKPVTQQPDEVVDYASFLSKDVIYEILSRVPATSLIEFKTVSKRWFDLISDPLFANFQLAYHLRNPQPEILFRKYEDTTKLTEFEHFSINVHDKDARERNLQLNLMNTKRDWIDIVDSCNGLLLLQKQQYGMMEQLCVCNLLTGQFTTLPYPKCWVHGFGLIHDASIQKYKVVGFPVREHYACYVFTLNSEDAKDPLAWRKVVTPFEAPLLVLQPLALINKEAHWMTKVEGGWSIFSMDIAKEKFRETKGPPSSGPGYGNRFPKLFEMDESMSAITYFDEVQLDIWVLQDRANSLWTKKYSLSLETILKEERFNLNYQSCFAITDTGKSASTKIVFSSWKALFFYDLKSRELKHLDIRINEKGCIQPYLFFHINSLVNWE